MYDQKYPIGQFETPAVITEHLVSEWISAIAAFPGKIAKEAKALSDLQLDTPDREGGTLRQVVHHCADSHMNAFCHFKLALTEKKPVIKPYAEAR